MSEGNIQRRQEGAHEVLLAVPEKRFVQYLTPKFQSGSATI